MQSPSDSPPPENINSVASSLKALSQSPPPDTAVSRSSIPSTSESYNCQWVDCSAGFTDPEVLYNHLCNDHIGRKSTNNLCLTCKWKDCGTSCAKRDHITSHLRVHTPLKPHVCEICKKSFKRPQDLKKHEKIHTEEHHAQHKHSKAITVNDPAYASRVRGDAIPSSKGALNRSLSGKLQGAAPGALPSKVPFARSRPRSGIGADGHYSALPTPSPELEPHPSRHVPHSSYELFLHNQVPSWDSAKSDARPSNRNKRSLEYSVDDFFTEMKKRKVNPAYDNHMVERLNNLAYAQDSAHYDEFNPRSVSFDVRTPEELAAVNEFLVTLGRDVTANNRTSQDLSGRFSPTSYFDADSLSQLGLTGMPGLLGPGTAYAHDVAYTQTTHPPHQYATATYPSPPSLGRSSHPSVQQTQYSPVYPPMHASTPGGYSDHYTSSHQSRVSASASHDYALNTPSSTYAYHSTSTPQGHFHPTPPLDPTSPHSSSSTPSNATPPHHSSMQESFAEFGSLRGPRGAPPPVQMAAPEYHHKVMRTMIPLKTAPVNAPELVAPALPTTTHRGSINALLSPPSSSAPSSSKLYPLLLPEDSHLKLPSLKPDAGPFRLPPIKDMYRRPSPQASASQSPDTSRGSTPSSTRSSPVSTHTTPGLRSITETSGSDELVREVGKIQLDHLTKEVTPEDRRKHAELIRNLLVKINEDYRKRFGSPQMETSRVLRTRLPSVDVEMAAA
ncbi:hypothetical protein EV702DRAFT_1057903 [Suillus placidus]|uniref:C2H2-type domain-containing protein n=1 Tax=Suillus placidus TaxID=48579 RepID=A0A9P7A9M6_9AGAM|nr:hypothetical protein EV702DRAFT_1057903 [Suillus placidus]